jgi:hypothetical protein
MIVKGGDGQLSIHRDAFSLLEEEVSEFENIVVKQYFDGIKDSMNNLKLLVIVRYV